MEWKKVEGFPNYSVSDLGQVRNDRTGHILAPFTNGNGYLKVTLCGGGKKKKEYIHRLVGFAFLDGYKKGYTVHHKNYNRQCNEKHNLEWVSLEDNIKDMHKRKAGA